MEPKHTYHHASISSTCWMKCPVVFHTFLQKLPSRNSLLQTGNQSNCNNHNSEAAAHEAGHLLLLPDRYHKDDQSASGYSADPGWEGTIMAEPCGKGRVTQRDVNEVLDIMLNVN